MRKILSALAGTILVAAACGPAQPAGPAPAADPTAKAGGTIRVTLNQEPDTLNPLFGGGLRVANTVMQTVFNGLWISDEKGAFQPDLAAEVPTVQNGSVSRDGKTITVKLRNDVKWADGKPFTAHDVKFTYDISRVNSSTLRNNFTDMIVKDDHTLEWRMSQVFGAYLTLFSYPSGIVPKHAFPEGISSADMQKHEFGRKPFGTGPFRVTEWQAASHITLEPNPSHFRGKAKLDRLIFRITPDKNTQLAQVRAGETDIAVDLIETDTPELERLDGWKVFSIAGPTSDRLFLNLAKPGDPADNSVPHPILGDKNVRKALELSINKQELVDKILLGKTKVATSEYPIGWAAPNIAPTKYDPAEAQRLLEQAGWRAGADGIREKGGTKLSLAINSTAGNKLREDVEALLQAGWKRVGIDLQIRNQTAAVLVGEWTAGGTVQRGKHDIAFYGFTPGIDPRGSVSVRFHSDQIPRDEPGKQSGSNNMRFRNPEVDRLVDEADATLDLEKRKANYARVMQIVADEVPIIYLYNRANIEVVSNKLVGPKSHPFRWLTWNTHEWGLR
jgi:peptide/nickel transport system substrate-binding protein